MTPSGMSFPRGSWLIDTCYCLRPALEPRRRPAGARSAHSSPLRCRNSDMLVACCWQWLIPPSRLACDSLRHRLCGRRGKRIWRRAHENSKARKATARPYAQHITCTMCPESPASQRTELPWAVCGILPSEFETDLFPFLLDHRCRDWHAPGCEELALKSSCMLRADTSFRCSSVDHDTIQCP